jgi:hypothetical protein
MLWELLRKTLGLIKTLISVDARKLRNSLQAAAALVGDCTTV